MITLIGNWPSHCSLLTHILWWFSFLLMTRTKCVFSVFFLLFCRFPSQADSKGWTSVPPRRPLLPPLSPEESPPKSPIPRLRVFACKYTTMQDKHSKYTWPKGNNKPQSVKYSPCNYFYLPVFSWDYGKFTHIYRWL